ncbi:MAG: TldD/PmbA family protein [Methanomassiliicoccales archaeon]|nr:TldD/PmbA family protein [Methanomassiliicoccales archaeon]
MELQDITAKALRLAKKGASEAEAYSAKANVVSVYVDDSKIKSVETRKDSGVAMRVISDGRVGSATSKVADETDVMQCVETALGAASLSPKDPIFKHFPYPAKSTVKPKGPDSEIIELESEDLVGLVKDVVSVATQGKKVKVPNGVFRAAFVETWLSNSSGVETGRKNTMLFVHATAMTTGGKTGEGDETHFSPDLAGLVPDALGKALRDGAISSSKRRSFHGKKTVEVLVPPHELAEMFHGSIDFALNAENVNRRRSPWAGKFGKACADASITLIDDPADPRGVMCSGHDDEGSPSGVRPLVEKGVLKGFMYDAYNAAMSSKPTTGNGLRRSPIEPMGHYHFPVRIGPMNLVMKSGKKSVDELVEEVDDGLLIQKFSAPDVHPITGAFALEVRCGHLIEKGEIKGTVSHCLLTGNMFEALMNVNGVANDAVVYNSHIVPTLRFGGQELVGSD